MRHPKTVNIDPGAKKHSPAYIEAQAARNRAGLVHSYWYISEIRSLR